MVEYILDFFNSNSSRSGCCTRISGHYGIDTGNVCRMSGSVFSGSVKYHSHFFQKSKTEDGVKFYCVIYCTGKNCGSVDSVYKQLGKEIEKFCKAGQAKYCLRKMINIEIGEVAYGKRREKKTV